MTDSLNEATLAHLSRPLRLTLAGIWAERLLRAFWPLWSILFVTLAALSFDLHQTLPVEIVWVGLVAAVAGTLWALVAGLRQFRRPTREQALARLDATMPGRPIATLADTQAVGTGDPASQAVWQAHRTRMAERAAAARAVIPDLRLARQDPFGLRFIALTVLVMGLLFGSLWRAATVTGLAPGQAEALAAGPAWEGWLQPPPYTGKPALYLNDIDADTIEVPVGTRVQIRLYGEVGALTLSETVSGRAGTDVPPASDPAQEFVLTRSGQIVIDGQGGRTWVIAATPDKTPTITPKGEVTREKDGRLRLPFAAADDYGVTGGRAEITLDLAAIQRRYGLTIDPEAREPLILDLPMPIRGDRASFEEALVDDVSKHPFANLPVQVRLSATDAINQVGQSSPLSVTLPGKRFFDPVAAALAELRRDLLWNRANAPMTTQWLKAILHEPEGLIRKEGVLVRLRVLLRKLDAEKASLTPEDRDAIADELWELALLVEEGDLKSAMERLQRAQDRLDEAIRNGADQAEIEELMEELREAMRDYMEELSRQAEKAPGPDEPQQDFEGMMMSGDQLQQMMDELQKLMEEGRMAEAAELMEQMRQLMENMRVVEGQGGQGQGNPSMRDLGQTLRDQQGLSDDSFRELQDPGQGQQGQNGEQQPGEGDQPGEGQEQGQNGPGDGPPQGSLSERQRELRNRLGQLERGDLPGDGSEAGEEGRRRLDEAGRAMEEAERALREGDLPGAMDRQAEAMEALREGIRNFGQAMAEEQQRQNGQNGQMGGYSEERGKDFEGSAPDPLGRNTDGSARIGNDRNALQGDDVYRRAEELLGEIRRRQGEQTRPETERDYLRRLLDMF
jgi:uncharacterized protein (TIGR02302 family)